MPLHPCILASFVISRWFFQVWAHEGCKDATGRSELVRVEWDARLRDWGCFARCVCGPLRVGEIWDVRFCR